MTSKMYRRRWLFLSLFVFTACAVNFWFFASKEDPGNTGEPLRIVALLPLTGTSSDIGKWQQQGIELAKLQLNADRPSAKAVTVIYEDTASDVKTGISSFEKTSETAAANAYLISLSSVANALAPRFVSRREPALLLAVSLPKISQRSENYFRFNLGSEQEAEHMANYIKSTTLKRIAVLYINDEFGQGARETFLGKIQDKNINIVYDDSYQKNQTDFRSVVLRLTRFQPDAVYVIGYVKSSILLIKQMREQGLKSQVFANMALSVPAFQRLGGASLDGTVFTVTDFRLDSTAPQTQMFIKKYQDSYRDSPSFFAAFAYDSLITLAKASEYQGTLRQSLARLSPFTAATGEIKFDPKRNLLLKVRVVRNDNGKLVDLN